MNFKKLKSIKTVALVFLLVATKTKAQVKIGDNETTIEPSSLLELESNSKGLLLPRLTSFQRNSISSAPSFIGAKSNGLMIFNTTEGCLNWWNNSVSSWVSLCDSIDNLGDHDFHVYTKESNTRTNDIPMDIGSDLYTEGTLVWGAKSNNISARYSAAWGENNRIEQPTSTFGGSAAWGSYNILLGQASAVWGSSNRDTGNNSAVWGSSNTNSGVSAAVWGTLNKVYSNYSAVGGKENTVFGESSFAMGENNTLSGIYSVVHGYFNQVSAGYSAAFGERNVVSGSHSIVAGRFNNVGSHSIAVGTRCVASDFNSGAFGQHDTATAIGAFAIGEECRASGRASIALGYRCKANGSLAFGSRSVSDGGASIGSSNYTKSGWAFGSNNRAEDLNALALGNDNQVYSNFSTAIGNLNEIPVGATLGAFAFGRQNTVSGNYSMGLGYNTTSSGYGSMAFGFESTASGQWSLALGVKNISSGFASTAMGFFSTASGARSFAMGDTARALHSGTFVIGQGISSTTLRQFSSKFVGGYRLFSNTASTTGVTLAAGASAWTSVSDRRAKSNIANLGYGLNTVMQLRPTSYNYNGTKKTSLGFIAQEVQTVIPEVIEQTGMGPNNDYIGINYTELIPVLTKAIQELKAENDTLKSELAKQSNDIEYIKTALESNGIEIKTVLK